MEGKKEKQQTVPSGLKCLADESGIGVVEIILILVNIFTMGFQMQCYQGFQHDTHCIYCMNFRTE